MAGRCKALQDESVYGELIKRYLTDPKECTLHWHTLDLDVVAGHYEKFLCAFAGTGCKVHVALFTKCLHDSFQSNVAECKAFAQKMADVLSYCRNKGKPSRRHSDVRTAKAVIAIMDAIKAAKGGSTDEILSSSDEVDLCEEAPATPPVKGTDGCGASQALKKLQEAWGDCPPVSSTACGSTSNYVPDSPISVASSGVAASPVPTPSSSPHVPDKPAQVPGFTFFGSPAFLEYMLVGRWHLCPFPKDS